jgi:leucyl-tRNA synthetase
MNHFRFNTSIAALMELINELSKSLESCVRKLPHMHFSVLQLLLAPVAPHLAEECNAVIGNKDSLFAKPLWFEPDPAALVQEEATVAVQVNGKLRMTITVPQTALSR